MAEKTLNGTVLSAKDIEALDRSELVSFCASICSTALKEQGKNGYRGGIRPGNLALADGEVIIGAGNSDSTDKWSKDELEYIAPELFWHGEYSARADVYAIGLVLYAGINGGALPFVPRKNGDTSSDERAAALKCRLNGDKFALPWGIGSRLAPIVQKALAFNAEERYASPAELYIALTEYLEAVPAANGETAQRAFGKTEDELSEVEKMMVGIINKSVIEDDVFEPPIEVEVEPDIEVEIVETEPEAEPEDAPVQEEPDENDIFVPEEKAVEPQSEETPEEPEAGAEKVEDSNPHAPAVCYIPPDFMDDDPIEKPIKKQNEPKKKGKARPVLIVITLCLALAAAALLYKAFGEDDSAPPSPSFVLPSAEVTPTPTPSTTPMIDVYTSSFSVSAGDLSWENAEKLCVEAGGHLAAIRSIDEYNQICALADESGLKYLWIGCYRDVNGNYAWLNEGGSDYQWASGEPSLSYKGQPENYIMLVKQSDGTWLYNDNFMDPLADYSHVFSGRIGYVCELITVTQVPAE